MMLDRPETKAQQLLLENLTPTQANEYYARRSFHVEVRGLQYRLEPGITVREKDGARFCAVGEGLPPGDQLLARKLLLENSPDEFFRVANRLDSRPTRTFFMESDDAIGRAWQRALANARSLFQADGFKDSELSITWLQEHAFRHIRIQVRYGHAWSEYLLDEEHLASSQSVEMIFDEVLAKIRHDLKLYIMGRFPECRLP